MKTTPENPHIATRYRPPTAPPKPKGPYYSPQDVRAGWPGVIARTAVGLILVVLPPSAETALITAVIGATFDLTQPQAIATSALISLAILSLAFLSGRSYRARKDHDGGHAKWLTLALGWALAGIAMFIIRYNAHLWSAVALKTSSPRGAQPQATIESVAAAGDHNLAYIFLLLHCGFGIIAWYEGSILFNPIVFAHLRTSRKIDKARSAIANTAGLLNHVTENLESARGALAEQPARLMAAEIDVANYARYLHELARTRIASLLGTVVVSAMGRNEPKTRPITASPLEKT
ncbi:hypothetical protein OOZ51_09555 [Arthrobacter sp. MI7-26]|uniref:hypothetical protein n=1 Tax=Arthrobacter sp. MI7-26 TaxID=2993653 RepID=UPI0022496B2A|nr:hypothetical protein [Arthrobacter sp. MI7-26]MCX2748057.1 hypothetical protein [Arthrobacter sp. MI7-26]